MQNMEVTIEYIGTEARTQGNITLDLHTFEVTHEDTTYECCALEISPGKYLYEDGPLDTLNDVVDLKPIIDELINGDETNVGLLVLTAFPEEMLN